MTLVDQPIVQSTSLHKNPFFVIGATTRDNRNRLVELAEEQSLIRDADECRDAQGSLINLRSRLGAEMGWLPGVAPRKASQIVTGLPESTARANAGELPPLARANVLSAVAETLRIGTKPGEAASLILQLAETVEGIDPDLVLRDINEDRSVAGFPPVRDIGPVEEELDARKRHYRSVVRDLVDQFPSETIVKIIDVLVRKSTAEGTRHANALVQDLVDVFETGAQGFIQQEIENVTALIERAEAAAPHGESGVLKIIESIKNAALNFNRIAKPIQIVSKANGLDHRPSRELAGLIRGLAVDLHNEHGMVAAPAQLTEFLRDNFPHLDEISERTAEDAEYLKKAQEAQRQAELDQEEFNRSITYSAELGVLFKDKVQISPAGVYWRNNHMPLDAITRLRWGATRHSVNGIPTGTDFMIVVGDDRSSFTINMRNKQVYSELVDRLWRAAGVKILVNQVRKLKAGEHLAYPDAIIRDDGLTLTRHRMFGADEQVNLRWDQVKIWNHDGNFVVGAKDDKKVYTALSYQKHDNVHVLENMIRAYFKSSKPRLSQLLD
jgi:hypothetical protein